MKCPKCRFDNRDGVKFCEECGIKFESGCPSCGAYIPTGRKFCGECGHHLMPLTGNIEKTETERPQFPSLEKEPHKNVFSPEGERKHVTVLFSDLTDYTAISERLDPEDVRAITCRIFNDISKIISKYDGFVEKFAGDAIMAIFGATEVHEDDPVRAIMAAREIHALINRMGPELGKMVGQPISMHTGINTGLVVTGEVNLEKGVHGIAGDAINVASRLCGAAQSDEILVGHEVFRQAFGHFVFESRGFIHVKGKEEPLLIHKVTSSREGASLLRSYSILRSKLIGRKPEINELMDAVSNLKKGKGRIFSISGEAGTGKTRLIEEFRSKIDAHELHWFECHAYPYTQNIPYFPLMDLLNRLFGIDEEDNHETVKHKIESGMNSLVGEEDDIMPYIGSLYSIEYPEVADISPEFWRVRLQDAMKKILSILALRAPTIFLLEDLHWVDPSFEVLLRHTLLQVREPAMVLCVYRPTFSLFTSHQIKGLEKIYKEIRLEPLSSSEAQDMLISLLMTDQIPHEVRRLVKEKAEGNPFYVEEMVNSLIDSEILVREGKCWKLTGPIKDSTVSPTIHGIITGRLDRLEKETKRVLQEAAVIGRSFLYEILQRISTLQHGIDNCLRSLEQMDFIRTKAIAPDLEYIFKHALTQEVVYNGLLISQRRGIHERVAQVMEKLFSDRLLECYEALAYHYSQGLSVLKAARYLVKSGEKSYKRYSLKEAHQYFNEAFKLLISLNNRTKQDNLSIIDLLMDWSYVLNCRADYRRLEELLLTNENLANSTEDHEKIGMLYGWLGWALRSREKLNKGYEYLIKALHLGEDTSNHKVIGYACAWLSWTCADMGRLDDALSYGLRAQELIEVLQSDGEFIRFTLSGLGVTHYFRGECKETHDIGERLLTIGKRRSDLRCIAMGHNCIGFGHYTAGNYPLAVKSFQNAIKASPDTLFSSAAYLLLGMTYMANEQVNEAKETFEKIMEDSEQFGIEFLGTAAKLFHGAIQITNGTLNEGLKTVESAANDFLESGSNYRFAAANHTLGKVYAGIVMGKSEKRLSLVAKNLGFLMKNIPIASRKAESYYVKAIEVAGEIGANGTLGQVCLDLGLLYKFKKKPGKARDYISKSIRIFQKCGAEGYLKLAIRALESLSR